MSETSDSTLLGGHENDEGIITFSVGSAQAGGRLDRVLTELFAASSHEFSRSKIQDLIKTGCVSVDGKVIEKARHAPAEGDQISIVLPVESAHQELVPQDLPLEILFEDDDLIIINKQIGLVIHPAAGNPDGTLVNALLHHVGDSLRLVGEADRPGIVHRLDKDTSGCLVAAKTAEAHAGLVGQFSNRETSKTYLAVVDGIPAESSGRIENRIGRHPVQRQKMAVLHVGTAGKEAITEFTVIATGTNPNWATVECRIFTGRTHQIRVHMKENLRCSILGDPIYANLKRQKPKVDRLMLHAWKLGFRHPVSEKDMAFEAQIPELFASFLP